MKEFKTMVVAAISLINFSFLGILGGVVLLELIVSFRWPVTHDSTFLHYVAYLINEEGFLPYRDIFEFNMPGTYLIHMAIGKTLGYENHAFHIASVIWISLLSVVTWQLMRPAGRTASFGSIILFLLLYLKGGPHMILQRDAIAVLPIALAALMTVRYPTSSNHKLILTLIGICFGFAATIKPHFLIGLPAVILYLATATTAPITLKTLITSCLSKSIPVTAGATIIIAIPFFWLWRIDAIESFIELYTQYVPFYVELSGDVQFREPAERLTFAFSQFFKFGRSPWLYLTALVGVFLTFTPRSNAEAPHDSSNRRCALLLLALALLYSVYAAIGGKFWDYHWTTSKYFACLCTALIFSAPLKGESLLKVAATFAAIAITIATSFPNQYMAISQLFQSRPMMVYTHPQGGRVDQISDYLEEHLSPGETAQPLDWITGAVQAMLQSKTPNATRFITDFQFYHHVSDPYIRNLRSQFIEQLVREMPTLIIDMKTKTKVSGEGVSYAFPELNQFVESNYEIVFEGEGYSILRRMGIGE